MKKYFSIFSAFAALAVSFFIFPPAAVADTLGQTVQINVNETYDQSGRKNLSATLRAISAHAYFYVEDQYWNSLNSPTRAALTEALLILAQDFEQHVYAKEVQLWGSEPNPGVDNDPRITVLLHDLKAGNGGYFDSIHGFPKTIFSDSNEREMFVISIEALGATIAKSFMSHEFQHLISFNQKELVRKTSEEVWLNELRSEYAISVSGFNIPFSGSSLENRIRTFLDSPTDSLTEWANARSDYAQVALFGQYLIEQFGPAILSETLQSANWGIDSINKWLISRGLPERFVDLFRNWAIANYLNDTARDGRYGYQLEGLKSFRITPQALTISYPNEQTIFHSAKPWQATWQRYNFLNLPADKAVKIEVAGDPLFSVAYVADDGRVGTFQPGANYLFNPGALRSVVLIPINQSISSGFGSNDPSATVSIKVSFLDNAAMPGQIKDGALIKRPHEAPIYVVEGKYKRYLSPEVIKLYGHLDASKAIPVDDRTFNSYTSSNYIRPVNDKKVYAVWPDGTKHWLNMPAATFTSSGRDWNSIFIVNELETNFYRTGPDIKQ